MRSTESSEAPTTVDEYVASVPPGARPRFDELRSLVRDLLPDAEECLTYGIVGYRTIPGKRARVFVSGWKDHVALYPVPHSDALAGEVAPYVRGKGTLWFGLDDTLPTDLLRRVVAELGAA
ncbi:iron chaperone [Aestuariimicrobium kwangyangense]|uniref:iron chaperone n=1 Tax=Aestuariimicrobium kwangyangense TaxID=396389 RepID=UPI0003B76D7D|nr:DUF1801 domain-containing protein [Aestuariimicrobium kwangyangense]